MTDNISKPKAAASSAKYDNRIGSKTAPLETDFNYEVENSEEDISTYNYYVYYNSIKPRDPRLKKPTYVPIPDMDFIKEDMKKEDSSPKSPENNFDNNFNREDTNNYNGFQGVPQTNLPNQIPQMQMNFPMYDQNQINMLYMQQCMNMMSLNDNNKMMPMNNLNGFMGIYPMGMNQMQNPYMMNMPMNNMSNMNNANNMGQGKIKQKKSNTINKNPKHNPNFVNRNQSLMNEITTFEGVLKNIIELSKDPSGSRFIQKKYEESPDDQKELMIQKILPEVIPLSKDIFGNYVIQRLMECSNKENQSKIISALTNKIRDLTLHMFGCRVVQKAIELSDVNKTKEFLSELSGELKMCIEDQNGNHVIQKIIEKLAGDPAIKEILNSAVIGNVYELSIHQYACRVIQRIFDASTESDKQLILEEIFKNYNNLCQDQFGNYVIQNILNKMQKGKVDQKFYDGLKGKIFEYSMHKFASNVVEKCLSLGTDEQNSEMIHDVLAKDKTNSETLINMVKDKYGNYVIQKMIEVANEKDKETIISKIMNSSAMKKRDGFSKHVMNFIEKNRFPYMK